MGLGLPVVSADAGESLRAGGGIRLALGQRGLAGLLRRQLAGDGENRRGLADGREVRHEKQVAGVLQEGAVHDGLVVRANLRGASATAGGELYGNLRSAG